MDVEQRYSLMSVINSVGSELDNEWPLEIDSSCVQLAAKCSFLSAPSSSAGGSTASSNVESEADGVWQLIGNMDLPRSMLLAGGAGYFPDVIPITETGGIGVKRNMLHFDYEPNGMTPSAMLIPSSPCISPTKYERGRDADSLLGLLSKETFTVGTTRAGGEESPSLGERSDYSSPLEDLKRKLRGEDSKYIHWNRRGDTIVTGGKRAKMKRAASECISTSGSGTLTTQSFSGCSVTNMEIVNLINSNVGIAHVLPCFDSPRDAIKRVSPTTVTEVLAGQYNHRFSRLLIVDCRYPYEYHGGHIPGAINVCSLEEIDSQLFTEADLSVAASTVIIFHCEFSSERAPRMALHVRNCDRVLNAENYPDLYYPQIYILDGGYKNFFLQSPAHCDPPHQYVPMRNSDHRDELRYHQRLRFNDGHSHGKHRHKLRSCSLRKSHSIAMPHPVAAISSYFRSVQHDSQIIPAADVLSSDIGDICDQAESIAQAAESILLTTIDDGRASK